MKRVLSLVLALVMVFGTIMPAFAEDAVAIAAASQAATDLVSYGLIAGSDKGLEEDQPLTRQEMAVIYGKMYGKAAEAEAYAFPSSFTDDPENWATPWIAYAEAQGWMIGDGAGTTFRPLDYVSVQEINTLMVKALGHEVTWATVNADAAALGVVVEAADETLVLRGEIFATIRGALDLNSKDATETLGTALALTGYVAPEPPTPAELEVVSVTALNAKEIEVTFNKELAKAVVGDYTVKDKGTVDVTETVALLADKMTVLITLDGVEALTNSTNATVTVAKGVVAADETKLAAAYTDKAVTVFDGTYPTATSIKAVGKNALEITFSEPVYDGTALTVAANEIGIKSGAYSYTTTSRVFDGNTLTLKTGTTLKEGDVVVEFNKTLGANPIQDFAGNKAFNGEITLAYVADTTSPTVAVKTISQTEVVLAFDRPVYGTDVMLYHSVSGVAAYGVEVDKTGAANAAKEWTFTFTNKIPAGNVTLFLENSSVANNQITDLFGNKMADKTLAAEITLDTTSPTVTETKLNTNASFDITFSEKLNATEAEKVANYAVTDKDAKDVAFSVAYDADKKVTITFTSALTDNADYQITVKAAKDVAGNTLATEYVEAINAGDNTAPDVSTTTAPYFTDAKTIYVVFTEDMNADDLVNKALYLADIDSNGTFEALADDDTVEAVSANKVKITIDAGGVDANSDLKIGTMRDLAGKVLVDSATAFFTLITDVDSDELLLATAETIEVNKVLLTFNKELSSFDSSEFTVVGSTIDSVESMEVNADGVTEVVVVLTTDLATDATFNVTTPGATVNTKSTELTVLKISQSVASDDGVAPTVEYIKFVDATTIEVLFSEDLDAALVGTAGLNGFSVTGKTTFTKAVMATPAVNGTTIVLSGTGFTADSDVNYTPGFLADVAGNKVAEFANTDELTALVATEADTPDATFGLAMANYDEVYVAETLELITAAPAAAAAQGSNDFTFQITSALPGTVEAGDKMIVALSTTGAVIVTITDDAATADSLDGTYTITITNVTTTLTETVSVAVTGTTAVVTE